MSIPTVRPGSRTPLRQSLRATRERLDAMRIGGRPISWFVTGWRGALIVLLLVVLFPQFIGNNGAFTGLLFNANESLLVIAISIGIYVMLALGLNIVVGYAGLLDLGYVAFFVIGSYTVAVFTGGILLNAQNHVVHVPTITFWLLLPLAAVLAGIFGVLLGAPTLRLRGDYLAIVTLGFGAIVPDFFRNVPFFFYQNGMSAVPPPDVGPVTFSDPLNHLGLYYLTLVLVVLVIVAVKSLRDSSLGRAWIAIREDETAASASGVNLVRTKLLAFGLGAVTGGVAGAVQAIYLQSILATDFNFNISITILIMIVLGGIGSIPGVIVGAIILRFFDAYLLGQIDAAVHSSALVADPSAPLHFLTGVDFNIAKFSIYGIVLLVMILLRPQGLIPNVRRQRELAGIGASEEGASAVGLLAREEADVEAIPESQGDTSAFAGAGSDAQGRDG